MTLLDALAALRIAVDDLKDAREAAHEARARENTALNKVNEAQKQFDASLAQTRQETAVPGSDWHRQANQGQPA